MTAELFYSDHRTYALWVYYNDHSYEYTDYRVDSELRYSGKGGAITEDDLRAALDKLGVEIPRCGQFCRRGRERGKVRFSGRMCSRRRCAYQWGIGLLGGRGGILYQVDNHLSVSTLHGNAAVISSQEAYERLL